MISIILAIASMALVVFMSWRILEKTGLPGWLALVHLLALTGIGMLASLLFFWVLAFIRWPRDEQVAMPAGGPPLPPQQLPAPRPTSSAPAPTPVAPQTAPITAPANASAATMSWSLAGKLSDGTPGHLLVDDSRPLYVVSASEGPDVLIVPDPSIGSPHARILTAPGRIGLQDLGSAGGTWIDNVRLLPAHGARDIGNSRQIRFGAVELTLTRL